MPGLLKPNKRKQAMTMKNNNTSLALKNSVLTVIAQQRLFLTGLGIVILAGTLAALLPPLVLEQIVNQLTLRHWLISCFWRWLEYWNLCRPS